MKLIDLTVYLWSGWPRGCAAVQQSLTGHIVGTYGSGKKRNLRNDPLPLCSDYASATVTPEMFEKAVAVSMRVDANDAINYLPNCSELYPPEEITSSDVYEHLVAQYEKLNAEPNKYQLLAEIAHLRLLMRDIISIHITTLREKRRIAKTSIAETESLKWLLGKYMAVWPYQKIPDQEMPYFCSYVTQDDNGQVMSHYEWNKQIYSYPVDCSGIPLAKDRTLNGIPQQVDRYSYERAKNVRLQRELSIQKHLHTTGGTVGDPSKPQPGDSNYGAWIAELARNTQPLTVEEERLQQQLADSQDGFDKYGDPL